MSKNAEGKDAGISEPRPHYLDHRQRLRERFRKVGFEGFKDYEALELLLTYSIPRKDVKPIAKALVSRFGSLRGVFDASFEELLTVNGVKESTATFLRIVKESAGLYLRARLHDKKVIDSTLALIEYCKVVMAGLPDEQFRAIFLNSQNEVIADEVIQEGTVNHSVVYPRKVMERALIHKAVSMIFVHNHPGGAVKPSKEDVRLTQSLIAAARALQLNVLDHLIIAREKHYSFRDNGMI